MKNGLLGAAALMLVVGAPAMAAEDGLDHVAIAADGKARLVALGPQAPQAQIETSLLAALAVSGATPEDALAALDILARSALTADAAAAVAALQIALSGPDAEAILASARGTALVADAVAIQYGGAGQTVDPSVLAIAGTNVIAALGDNASQAEIEAALLNALSQNVTNVQAALVALRILESSQSLSPIALAAIQRVAEQLSHNNDEPPAQSTADIPNPPDTSYGKSGSDYT